MRLYVLIPNEYGNGQKPKHVAVLFTQELLQYVGDEFVYVDNVVKFSIITHSDP
jgi:hypothetical protein